MRPRPGSPRVPDAPLPKPHLAQARASRDQVVERGGELEAVVAREVEHFERLELADKRRDGAEAAKAEVEVAQRPELPELRGKNLVDGRVPQVLVEREVEPRQRRQLAQLSREPRKVVAELELFELFQRRNHGRNSLDLFVSDQSEAPQLCERAHRLWEARQPHGAALESHGIKQNLQRQLLEAPGEELPEGLDVDLGNVGEAAVDDKRAQPAGGSERGRQRVPKGLFEQLAEARTAQPELGPGGARDGDEPSQVPGGKVLEGAVG